MIELYSLYDRTIFMDTEPSSEMALPVQEAMIALVRAFGLHQPERTPCGQPLPVAEAHALHELARAEPLPQGELAAWLRLEKSTVSRIVTLLVQKGWVVRERSQDDGRVQLLWLTDHGREVAAQLTAARQARFERLTAALPKEQQAAVVAALHTLVEAIDASR